MPLLRPAILKPPIKHRPLLLTTIPLISAALGLIYFTLVEGALQLIPILHVDSAPPVFLVLLPLAFVALLGL